MIGRLARAKLLWPAVFTFALAPVLIGLGAWQWQRMHWKASLLCSLEQAAMAEPVAMQILPPFTGQPTEDLAELQFRRVTVGGRFEHANEMHVWSPMPSGPGWSVVTPLSLDHAAAEKAGLAQRRATHVLVVRGAVADARKDPAKRLGGQPAAPVTITGRIRLDRPNTWAHPPNIQKNQWFTRDLALMQAHLGRTMASAAPMLAPFFIEAEQQIGGASAPKPDLEALSLSNRHLEYAFTWWGLAATLVGVFIAYAVGRLRASDQDRHGV